MKNQTFKQRLETIIEEKFGNDKKKLAKDTGVVITTINQWLNKNSLPNIVTASKIAKAAGESLEWLATGEKQETTTYSAKDQEYISKLLKKHDNTDIERIYVGKLISMFRAKDEGVISAITQNIDTFLRVKPEGVQEEVEQAKKTAG